MTKPLETPLGSKFSFKGRRMTPSPGPHTIIVHRLPEIRACMVAQETQSDIEKRPSIFKVVVLTGELIVNLKAQRLGPPGTNPPTSPSPVKLVVSDQAARYLLRKSRMFVNVTACKQL